MRRDAGERGVRAAVLLRIGDARHLQFSPAPDYAGEACTAPAKPTPAGRGRAKVAAAPAGESDGVQQARLDQRQELAALHAQGVLSIIEDARGRQAWVEAGVPFPDPPAHSVGLPSVCPGTDRGPTDRSCSTLRTGGIDARDRKSSRLAGTHRARLCRHPGAFNQTAATPNPLPDRSARRSAVRQTTVSLLVAKSVTPVPGFHLGTRTGGEPAPGAPHSAMSASVSQRGSRAGGAIRSKDGR
jgi:hypothetical protein